MVVSGVEGLDEISISGATKISWYKKRSIESLVIKPTDFKLKEYTTDRTQGSSPDENAKTLLQILSSSSTDNAKKSMVLANASAGIVLGGLTESFAEGVELARESIGSGKAYNKLKEMIRTTGGNLNQFEDIEAKK